MRPVARIVALWICDLADPEHPRKLEANAVHGWAHLALSSDGRFAILAGKDQALWRWDLQTGDARHLRPIRADVTAIALSPDNQLVAYVDGGAIELRDAITGAKDKKKAFNGRIGNGTDLIAFCPDGRRIVSTHSDRTIRTWDVKTGRAIGLHTEAGKLVTGLSVFPDSRALTSFSGPTFVWDLATSQQLRRVPGFGASISVSADGRRALIGGGNLMQLWELADRRGVNAMGSSGGGVICRLLV